MKLAVTLPMVAAALLLVAGDASAQGRSREHSRARRGNQAASSRVYGGRTARAEQEDDGDEQDNRSVNTGRRHGDDDEDDDRDDDDRNDRGVNQGTCVDSNGDGVCDTPTTAGICVDANGDGICDNRQGGTARTGGTARRGSTRGSARGRVIYGTPSTGAGTGLVQLGTALLQRLMYRGG